MTQAQIEFADKLCVELAEIRAKIRNLHDKLDMYDGRDASFASRFLDIALHTINEIEYSDFLEIAVENVKEDN